MRHLRLVLIAGVLFGACSCSEVAGDLEASKPEQIRCQAGPDCDLKWGSVWKVKQNDPRQLSEFRNVGTSSHETGQPELMEQKIAYHALK